MNIEKTDAEKREGKAADVKESSQFVVENGEDRWADVQEEGLNC